MTGLSPDTTYEFRVYGETGSPTWGGTRSIVSNTATATTVANNPTIQQVLNNIDSSSNISSKKKTVCKTVARELLNSGYEVSFVAGMISNICYEGDAGLFEDYHETYAYHRNFNSYLISNYGKTYMEMYDHKHVYEVDLTTLYNIIVDLNNRGWQYNGSRIGMGIGCVQWTMTRSYPLLEIYREVAGAGNNITFEQTLYAEGLMISRELTGGYKPVYDTWKSENGSNLNSQTAAYSAGYIVCRDYERPGGDKNEICQIRGELARQIYIDLIK